MEYKPIAPVFSTPQSLIYKGPTDSGTPTMSAPQYRLPKADTGAGNAQGLLPWTAFDVSPELVASIVSGDTVLFLGAGWDAPAKLPSWVSLLQSLIANPKVPVDKRKPMTDLIAGPSPPANNLDQCAQMLEDILGTAQLVQAMKGLLTPPTPLPALMQRRIQLIKDIPFVGILTTNYTTVTPGKTPQDVDAPYVQILRPQDCLDDPLYAGAKPNPKVPVIQVHGNFGNPKSIVLTTQGYRSLLFTVPGYMTFLKSLMATKTVLYLGFSFSDAYINEIRSEVVSMLDDGVHIQQKPPIGYALVPNMPQISQEYFLANEGVHITTWDTSKDGWGKFEDWLAILGAKVKAASAAKTCAVPRPLATATRAHLVAAKPLSGSVLADAGGSSGWLTGSCPRKTRGSRAKPRCL